MVLTGMMLKVKLRKALWGSLSWAEILRGLGAAMPLFAQALKSDQAAMDNTSSCRLLVLFLPDSLFRMASLSGGASMEW